MCCRTIGEAVQAARSELPISLVWTGDPKTVRSPICVSFRICSPATVERFYEHYQPLDNANTHVTYLPTVDGWDLELSKFRVRVTQNTTPWEPMTPKQFLGFIGAYSQTGNSTKDSEIEMQ